LGVGLLVTAAASAFAVAPSAATGLRPPAGLPSAHVEAPSARPRSNIAREDYVGPEVCRECHAEVWEQWHAHPHRLMNADATEAAVVGDFSGVQREYGEITTTFERRDDRFVMSHHQGGELLRRDAVTRTIGSRLQQAYVGVQIEGPEPAGDPIYTTERALPYVYWFSRGRWYPEHYVEQYPDPEYDDDGRLRYPVADPRSRGTRPWAQGCMLCHNTYAYELRFNDDVPGRGFLEARMRPADRAAVPNGPSPEDLVTLGVSCEACHLGGRDHVELQREVDAVPTSPRLLAHEGPSALTDAAVVNSICAQCHVAGSLPYPNGASSLNSSEALDLRSGACASQIACTDCHDPHVGNPPGGGPDAPAHVAACGRCHDQYATETGRRAHARHDGKDASCLDCHMPRLTQGIDTVVRSHRIDSPTNPQMLAAASINACNLCHLDRTIGWTLAELREGWGAELERTDAWSDAYGEDDATMLQTWLEHPTPIVRLVASDALARSPNGITSMPQLLPLLMDAYPENRMFGLFAIERLWGRRIDEDEYAPMASEAVRARQIEELGDRISAAASQ
jgi:hypothetical protein